MGEFLKLLWHVALNVYLYTVDISGKNIYIMFNVNTFKKLSEFCVYTYIHIILLPIKLVHIKLSNAD